MITDNNNSSAVPDEVQEEQSEKHTGDGVTKGNTPTEQKKPDDERIKTVTPDNDSGDPGPPAEER